MKKTLFLMLTLCVVSDASATITPERGKYGINSLVGNEVFTQDTTIDSSTGYYNAVLNVGTYSGEGHLTLEENVTLTLPNALMIGGKGYSMPVTTANNGTVILKQGAVINTGAKATSSGGHHVDVGTSDLPCTGSLYVNGATINTTQFIIGEGAATGYVNVTDGGTINLSWDGVIRSTDPKEPDQVGMKLGYHSGSGTLVLDNGHVVDTTGKESVTELQIGCAGDAHVSLVNGSTLTTEANVFIGDMTLFWGTAYGRGTETDTLDVGEGCSFSGALLMAMDKAAVNNAGTMNFEDGVYLYGTTMTNSGELNAGIELEVSEKAMFTNSAIIRTSEVIIDDRAVLDNTGLIDSEFITLGNDTKFITGHLVVSGCEEAMKPDHEMSTSYTTGLIENAVVVLDDGAKVTVGAHVNGGDSMQYLYSKDFRDIDAKVLETLDLQVATEYDANGYAIDWLPLAETQADVTVANVLGKNITANVTTDEASEQGNITVALSGSHLVVRVGDNGASDPTAADKEASAEKVGTLGSYHEDVTETDATVRLHTSATDSSVAWEGHSMQTVSGETSTVNDTTRVTIGSDGVEGTLTVVEDSTLQNHGDVSSDNVIVNGTLDNNGTISAATTVNGTLKGSGVMAATTIAETATLIVGNSPGYSTFTDALTVQSGASVVFSVAGLDKPASLENGKGWESHTYSQIVMQNGAAVTLCDGVNITIAFGGDELCSALTPLHEEQLNNFELVLIKGGVASTLDLVSLMNHTSFVISDEAGALPLVLTGQSWVLNISNTEYLVNNGDLVLRGSLGIARTPEPATATLSLLALAALAARRKRTQR
ncbi:MAG: hypothetical protein MJ051_08060 [Akkermansia sp.]|nr:hypothetical protein [Akkermansia sp.]